jgi:hypothetical protein
MKIPKIIYKELYEIENEMDKKIKILNFDIFEKKNIKKLINYNNLIDLSLNEISFIKNSTLLENILYKIFKYDSNRKEKNTFKEINNKNISLIINTDKMRLNSNDNYDHLLNFEIRKTINGNDMNVYQLIDLFYLFHLEKKLNILNIKVLSSPIELICSNREFEFKKIDLLESIWEKNFLFGINYENQFYSNKFNKNSKLFYNNKIIPYEECSNFKIFNGIFEFKNNNFFIPNIDNLISNSGIFFFYLIKKKRY